MRVLLLVAACTALSVAADARALLDAPAKANPPDADPPTTNKKWVHQMNPAVASAGTTGCVLCTDARCGAWLRSRQLSSRELSSAAARR